MQTVKRTAKESRPLYVVQTKQVKNQSCLARVALLLTVW
jgi:hypothetical protein